MSDDFKTYQSKKKLFFWRALVIILIIVLLIAFGSNDSEDNTKPHIARLYINEEIQSNLYLYDHIREIRDNKAVKGILLRINSPGGTSASAEAIYSALENIKKDKSIPIASSIDEIGTSAAYLVALASDRIFAYNTSLTGSIGMLMQGYDFTETASKIGIKFVNIKSDKYKAAPLPTEKMDSETYHYLTELVAEEARYFKELVREKRKLPDENFHEISTAKIFSGAQAHRIGLIDEIGGEDEAITWLDNEHKLGDLPIIDYNLIVKKNPLSLFWDLDSLSKIDVLRALYNMVSLK